MEPAFEQYLSLLIEWNKKFNLTGITEPDEIRVKHFEDSLTILDVIDLNRQKVIDIGSGAGFPGIPLKIKRPGIKLTLIESNRKKTEFLKHLVKLLDLRDVEIIWGRAEQLAEKLCNQYDLALARAVASLPKLVSYALPYLKSGGIFIAQKGPKVEDAGAQIIKDGGKLKQIRQITLSNGHQRSLVIIEKI